MAAWLGDSGRFDISTQNTFKPFTIGHYSNDSNTDKNYLDLDCKFDNFQVRNYDEKASESSVTSESEIIPKDKNKENLIGFSP